MSKLDKLLNKFSEKPTEDTLVAEFLDILRLGEDCFSDKSKTLITQDFFDKMKTKETYFKLRLKVGDSMYWCMLTQNIKRDPCFTVETSLRLTTIVDKEFNLLMLQPERYLRRIIVLDHDNRTYYVDRSFIKKDIPTLILKLSEKEVKESGEFEWFKYIKREYKKTNKK